MVYFISGHLDLTQEEFDTHYKPLLHEAVGWGCKFIVGDAQGADLMAQQYLFGITKHQPVDVVVYHMFHTPRNNVGFPTKGGFTSDLDRDYTMTRESDKDIAWVRPGRNRSGTQKNLNRRKNAI